MFTKRVGERFATDGYCNWKKAVENFKQHENSAAHREACEKIALMNSEIDVSCKLNSQVINEQIVAYVALKAICTSLLTLAQTGSSIRGHDDNSGNINA
jgi:hypothetical protein